LWNTNASAITGMVGPTACQSPVWKFWTFTFAAPSASKGANVASTSATKNAFILSNRRGDDAKMTNPERRGVRRRGGAVRHAVDAEDVASGLREELPGAREVRHQKRVVDEHVRGPREANAVRAQRPIRHGHDGRVRVSGTPHHVQVHFQH
jgi:hypothetical protein